LSAVRLSGKVEPGSVLNFDVKARMNEKERRRGWVSVGFALSVGTRPNVVKYEVEGIATLEGKDEEIQMMLEVDTETQVPLVFSGVYKQTFMSMYLLSTLIDSPPPPANLLQSDQREVESVERREAAQEPDAGQAQPSGEEAAQEVPASVPEAVSAPVEEAGVAPQQTGSQPSGSDEGETVWSEEAVS
jgi:hypothetical protein